MPDTPLWRRRPDVAVVESPGRVVLLPLEDPVSARPLVMEGPAAAIWQALGEPATAAEVVARVAVDFGVPAAEVEGDVMQFLAELLERRLLDTSDLDGG